MNESQRITYISLGLVVSAVIGLFLYMYQKDVYGASGLGIVFTPIIGVFVGATFCSLKIKFE